MQELKHNNFEKGFMKFTIYSKNGCPYCDKVQELLDLAKVKYEVYELDEDFTEKEFYDKFGLGTAFPQVICDDKILGGCINTIKHLQENNLL